MATRYATRRLASVSSTQDEALARYEGAPLLVIADEQTAGRGRTGTTWLAAPRAVFASLALAPAWPVAAWPKLSLVAALAAAEVLGGRLGLKWPNDLLDGRGDKVGGLLAETRAAEMVVIGLGVNVWWPDPPPGMAALLTHDPGADEPSRLARAWASAVLRRVAGSHEDWGRDEYLAASVTVGRHVTWEPAGSGRAVDVDRDGSLVVETADGVATLTSGSVGHVRPSGALP